SSIPHVRQHLVRFSTPYQSVQQDVVFYQETGKAPKTVAELLNKNIAVPEGSSYAERLNVLAQDHPRLQWQASKSASTDELIEQVAEGTLDYTVADDHLAAMLRNFYPNLGVGMTLGDEERIAWAFPKTDNRWLYDQANIFFARIQQ